MRLGCIADDLTGASDLALMLSREGLKTVQTIGVPDATLDLSGADAVVVALKSRTLPGPEAVTQSIAAAAALRQAGATHFFFKYCSTFDSTDEGNIGNVAEALLSFTGSPFTLACPAFPANGRTVYQGYLFVNGVPLHESSMKDHPLTPMRDSNLVRVLQRQTALSVGLVPFEDVEAGVEAVKKAFARAQGRGQSDRDRRRHYGSASSHDRIGCGRHASDNRGLRRRNGLARSLSRKKSRWLPHPLTIASPCQRAKPRSSPVPVQAQLNAKWRLQLPKVSRPSVSIPSRLLPAPCQCVRWKGGLRRRTRASRS